MGYSPWGHKESDTTEVIIQTDTLLGNIPTPPGTQELSSEAAQKTESFHIHSDPHPICVFGTKSVLPELVYKYLQLKVNVHSGFQMSF